MKTKILVLFLTAVLCSGSLWVRRSHAQDTLYYLGGYLSYAMENLDDANIQDQFRQPVTVSFDNTFGLQVRGGMRINEYLFAEAMIEFLTPFEDSSTEDTTIEVSVIDAGVNLKAILAFLGRVEPYGLVGLGLLYADQQITFGDEESSGTDVGLAARLGFGVDVVLTPAVTVGGEAAYVTGFGDPDYVSFINFSFGMTYHF